MPGIEKQIRAILKISFIEVVGDTKIDPLVHNGRFSDFQADGALKYAKSLGSEPIEIAKQVVAKTPTDGIISSIEISPPGFINIKVSNLFLASELIKIVKDEKLGVVFNKPKRVVIDYSSPNVAKEMHVGHLRSTIIGDACVRLLTWVGHEVVLRNHIGDWGTPFGMLIEHLIDVGEHRAVEDLSLGSLNKFYQSARSKYEALAEFKDRSKVRVVALQSGDVETNRLWMILTKHSKAHFTKVYDRLNIKLRGKDFYGESSYNSHLVPILSELSSLNLIKDSEGAKCLFPDGFSNRDGEALPLIFRKSDGGFGYAATDLAAIKDRIFILEADRLLYVVGAPQQQHLAMVFKAAKMAGWLAEPVTAEHVSFGSVLGVDGKMLKSRSGEAKKLEEVLDEGFLLAMKITREKNPSLSSSNIEKIAKAVAVGAIKYADLSTDRRRDYIFDFERMFSFEGNTAPYIQYANARIASIFKEGNFELETETMKIQEATERELAIQILKFPDVIDEVSASLMFHRLTDYLFGLATAFSRFYGKCPILEIDDISLRNSRLILCETTQKVLTTGLDILGIESPNQM